MESTIPYYFLCLSFVYHDLGEFARAQNDIYDALELSKKYSNRLIEGQARIWLGRISGKINPSTLAKAEEQILQGIKILEELKFRSFLSHGYFFLGELYANKGRKDDALENLNKSLSMCQEMGIEYWPDKIKEALDRVQYEWPGCRE